MGIHILGNSEIWLNIDRETLLTFQFDGECVSLSWGTDDGMGPSLLSAYFQVDRFILFNKVKHE